MKKIKNITASFSKIGLKSKKVIPVLGNFLSTLDLVDNIFRFAKPFFDDARDKNIEESKKIYAYQVNTLDKVIIYKSKVGIEISGDNEEDAFRSFAQEIKELKEKRKVSSNKKIRKEQLKLIRKIDNIEKDNEDFQKYLYRIVIDNDDYKKK